MMIVRYKQAFACALVLGSSLLGSAHALAAVPIRDELPVEAKQDWDAARELYDAGDPKSALVHFERAYKTSKNPRVLFNVGVCWKDLTQYSQAIRAWRTQLLRRDELDPKDVERTEQAIAAVRSFVSSLQLQSEPAGATVSIDGQEVGHTPFAEPVAIDVGRRKLTLTKEGFLPLEQTIDVVQGTPLALSLKLTPLLKLGDVSITTLNSQTAALFMDGRELGPAPFAGQVPAGAHTFEARAPGYEIARQTSDVLHEGVLHLSFGLAQARSEGKMRVITSYSDAAIQLDGKLVGHGAWEGLVPSGGHRLEVSKDRYEPYASEVSLNPGQQRTFQVELDKKEWVWWTVSIATVLAGGAIAAVVLSSTVDTSPVTGTLDPGTIAPRF